MHEDRRTFLGVLFGATAAPALVPKRASAQARG
jgi:hypothetical protein